MEFLNYLLEVDIKFRQLYTLGDWSLIYRYKNLYLKMLGTSNTECFNGACVILVHTFDHNIIYLAWIHHTYSSNYYLKQVSPTFLTFFTFYNLIFLRISVYHAINCYDYYYCYYEETTNIYFLELRPFFHSSKKSLPKTSNSLGCLSPGIFKILNVTYLFEKIDDPWSKV